VKKERGGSGGCERVRGGCGDKPAVELRNACGVVSEVEIGELEANGCGSCRYVAGGVKDELPLALVIEKAECGPGEKKRDEEDDAEGFEDPAWVYELGCAAKLGRAAKFGRGA
jgi:hypothetical protein